MRPARPPDELLAANPNRKSEVGRFKGLGEMPAVELWNTTMNPESARGRGIDRPRSHSDTVLRV